MLLNFSDAKRAKEEEKKKADSIKIEAFYAHNSRDCMGAGEIKEKMGRIEDGIKDIYYAKDFEAACAILELLYHEGNAYRIEIIYP